MTKYYFGNYEEEITGTNVRKIHYLSGAIYIDNSNYNDSLYYTYTDNQGSVIALTDESGNVKRKYAYDPWGVRRNAANWTQNDNGSNLIISRGYTGHEHIDAFGIINMNGRVYDPTTAMFFSPDPFVQSPGDWSNYNRYSYVSNNPTKFTDPSGYVKGYFDTPKIDPYWSRIWNLYSEREPLSSRKIDRSGGGMGQNSWNNYIENTQNHYTRGYGNFLNLWYEGNFVNGGRLVSSIEPNIVHTKSGSYVSYHQQGWIVETKWVEGGAKNNFFENNWKDLGFIFNDFVQVAFNKNTTLAIAKGYNLAKTTIFLPFGLNTQASTKFISAFSKTGGVLAEAAPWICGALIVNDVLINQEINAGHLYQSIVTGLSLIPGAGLIVGGGALLLEGASYYFTGKGVADNINSKFDGGVIIKW